MAEPTATPPLVRHRCLVLIALGVLAYLPFNGLRDLWYPDEPDIGEVCLAMFESGDWIVPRSMGQPWVDYWPGLYWAGTLAGHLLGGVDAFSLRAVSAIAGILLALATCRFASRTVSPAAGLWSGLALLTFLQFAYNAVCYRPDVLFAAFAGGGVLVYASGCDERARLAPRIAGFALLGLAVLVKGPVGLLLPGLVLACWHAARRELGRLLALAPLSLVACAIALPWAFACASASSAEMGSGWFWGEIHAQNFARFDEGGRGHVHAGHYYLTRIWIDLAPWSPLLPFAVARAWRRRRGSRWTQLALWWFGASFVFWSLAATKRQVYLLPTYPAIALLIGPYLAALTAGRPAPDPVPDPRPARALVTGTAVLLGVLGVGSVVAAGAIGPVLTRISAGDLVDGVLRDLAVPAAVVGSALAAAALWLAVGRHDLCRSLPRIALLTVALFVVAGAWLAPLANPLKTYAPQSRWLRERIGDAGVFGLMFPDLAHHKVGAFAFYSRARVELLKDGPAIEAFLDRHPDSVVLVHEKSAARVLRGFGSDATRRVERSLVAGRYRYLVVAAD